MHRLRRSRRVWPVLLLAVLAVASTSARAEYADSYEIWPQLSAYVSLGPRTRLYLDASYARGVESDAGSLDGSAFVDVSLKPILRKELLSNDWQRSRYIWMRAGYTRISKVSAGIFEVSEDRASFALYGKLPLPAGVLLEGRVRTDLRWIGGDHSTRYRFRAEATREFAVAGRPDSRRTRAATGTRKFGPHGMSSRLRRPRQCRGLTFSERWIVPFPGDRARFAPRSLVRRRLSSVDPFHMARHGCRPSPRPSVQRTAPAPRGCTVVARGKTRPAANVHEADG